MPTTDRPARLRPPRRRVLAAVIGGALAALASACTVPLHGTSDRLSALELDTGEHDAAERGIAWFAFGDFSALSDETLRGSATPWVLVSSLVTLLFVDGEVEAVDHESLAEAFRRFGFHSPAALANWPDTLPAPQLDTPLGMNVALATTVLPPVAARIANIGCASCHASVTYRADGQPDPGRVWLGSPNTSIHPEAFVAAIDEALRRYGDDPRLDQAIARLHPALGLRERFTLNLFVRPEVERRTRALRAALGRLTPYRLSVPGATNGLDALRARLGLDAPDVRVERSAFNSVPELGDRVWRSNLLNAGSYRVPGRTPERILRAEDIDDRHLAELAAITAFFAVPTMGVTPTVAARHIDDTIDVLHWLREHEPQPFPGTIDRALADRGATLYAARCASCHGEYAESVSGPRLTAFPNRRADVGSDPLTVRSLTSDVADRVEASVFGEHIEVELATVYRAPPLAGLWASAPYLHNGSVPTLWHLMRPDTRPTRFQVGGHALDLERVGIAGRTSSDATGIALAYPSGYRPWSDPVWIDTREPGLSNAGHESDFVTLDDGERDALLEYLKRL